MKQLLFHCFLFVGQLLENISLVLRTRDKVYFTNHLQTVIYYSNNSLLELIYFLIIDNSSTTDIK